jgi:hypothetical protein
MKASNFPKVYVRGANEYAIRIGAVEYLQSYSTVVVRHGEVITLDPKWEISRVTVSHVAKYLDETPSAIRKKLSEGIFALENLNI